MILKTSDNQEWLVSFAYNYDEVRNAVGAFYGPSVTCFLSLLNNATVTGVGVAICAPTDQFIKRIGRKIAFTRAMQAAKLSEEDRTELWKAYWQQTPYPKQRRNG